MSASSVVTPTSMPPTSAAAVSSATTTSGGIKPSGGGPPGNAPSSAVNAVDRDQIYKWILELNSPDTRETALLELSKKREVVPDLAPMLWNSFGTIAALLQVINL
jgi:CCR4-NOT transcription complex subunit 9